MLAQNILLSIPSFRSDDLVTPFSIAEIEFGLSRLTNGKSSGIMGCPAELFRYAGQLRPSGASGSTHMLSPILTSIFNLAFTQDSIPADQNVCLITPIFKRGCL